MSQMSLEDVAQVASIAVAFATMAGIIVQIALHRLQIRRERLEIAKLEQQDSPPSE